MRASWLLILPLGALIVLFAVSNTEIVTLGLWPFDYTVALPLSVAVLGVSAAGFLFGATVVWCAGVPLRLRARRLQNSADALRGEVDELRRALARSPAAASPPAGRPATALLPKP